ncbi:MAG: prepilin-type N-terminal cleavage/methylation domain-containing protein [bacterium]
MKSRTISTGNKGFTLIEMLIVVGIITIVGGISLFFGFDSLRGYSFHSDRDVLVSALQHARAEAMANICRGASGDCTTGKSHGVKIRPDEYPDSFVVFQGTSYAAHLTTSDKSFDAVLESKPSITYSGADEVVFTQLSGETNSANEIAITVTDHNTGKTDTIRINHAGQIKWDN